jgi:hypothetical protein
LLAPESAQSRAECGGQKTGGAGSIFLSADHFEQGISLGIGGRTDEGGEDGGKRIVQRSPRTVKGVKAMGTVKMEIESAGFDDQAALGTGNRRRARHHCAPAVTTRHSDGHDTIISCPHVLF